MLYAAGSGRGRAENSFSGFLPVIFVLACTLRYTRTCRGTNKPQNRAARIVHQALRCGSKVSGAHLVYAVHADEHGEGHSHGDECPQQAHVQLIERSIVGKGVQHRSYHTRPGLA